MSRVMVSLLLSSHVIECLQPTHTHTYAWVSHTCTQCIITIGGLIFFVGFAGNGAGASPIASITPHIRSITLLVPDVAAVVVVAMAAGRGTGCGFLFADSAVISPPTAAAVVDVVVVVVVVVALLEVDAVGVAIAAAVAAAAA